MTSKRAAGFTLVEVLVVLVILSIALGVLLSIFTSGLQAYRVEQERSILQQDAQATGQLLQYELALVGYRGTENSATVNARTFGGSPRLSVAFSGAETTPDQFTVRYYEDRYTNTASTLKTVIYSVNPQTETLRRQENAGAQEEIATGIRNLKVRSYLKEDGSSTMCATNTCALADTVTITIRLTLTNNSTQDVYIAFSTPLS